MLRATVTSAAVLTGTRITSMAVGIVLTPIILRHLGLELMGLYGLMAGILGYFALLDFGTGVAGMRFLTASRQNGSEEGRKLYGTLNAVSLAVGGVAILFSWLVMPHVLPLFAIPPTLAPLASWCALMAAGTFLFTLAKQQIYALLNAAGHFSGPALLDLGGTLAYAATMIIYLPLFPRLETLVYGFFGQATLQVILAIFFALTRGLCLRHIVFVCWDQAQFKRVFSFSRNVWLSNLSGIVVFESQKMFLGIMTNLEAVASYYVAGRFTSVQRAVGTGFASPLTRHATTAFSQGRVEEFRQQYRRSTGLFSWVQISAFILLFAFADRALHAWLGSETPTGATLLLRLQAAGMLCTLLCTVMNAFSRAAGITRPELLGAGVAIVTAILSNLVLIRFFGVAGAAWANLLALSLGSAAYFAAMIASSPLLRGTGVLRELARLLLPGLVLIALCYLTNTFVPTGTARWESVFWLGVAASPPALFCAGVLLWLTKNKP